MPVWHDRTRELRAGVDLVVIGLVQEQHPERCALYAQWQRFDWPIVWDPFNVTESKVVPRLFAIDEHGVVRSTRPDPGSFEADFVGASFEPPSDVAAAEPLMLAEWADDPPESARGAMARLLWGAGFDERALAALEAAAAAPGSRAIDHFRLGVARRMRCDSAAARPDDFQRALASWSEALDRDPNQYIWRRRIQQYGPRLDKPYPFYDWVRTAAAEVSARGEEPVALRAELTGAERAEALRAFVAAGPATEPDPEGRIARDGELVDVETAVAWHSKPAGERPARVHLALRPAAARGAHWNNEGEPFRVWIDVPEGWQADRRLLEHAGAPEPVSDEVRRLDFELRPPEGAGGEHVLTGYALFNVCEGRDGTCRYVRRDFTLRLRP